MRTLARFLPLLVLLAGLPATALADGFPAEASSLYGKIAGTVTDAASGEPLPGVNIFLVDSDGQGTATDLDGNYTILQVRPGTYSVRFTFIGFANQVVENVQVEVDRTTRIDVQLSEEVFEGQEVVVTAERGLVQVDRTTTTATVSGEELEALPVNSINDAISLQAGVVDGRFRGGRSGEVAFLVNGVPINNAFNNQAAFEVEQNMVSSLEVISGVFNAEYGQALSGVVSIVTKDLPDSWSGSFQGFAGALASTRELEFVDRSVGPGLTGADSFTSEELSYFEVAPLTNLIDLQASIGGPIIRDKLGIQLTGRYLNNDSHLFGRDLFNPADSSVGLNTGTDPANWIVESTGSGDFVSLSESERWSLNGTLSYQLSTNVKLDYNVFLQDGNGMPCWGRGGCHDQKYVPDGINRDRFNSQTHILGVRYTLGTKSFGNVSYSYLRDKYDSFLYESPFDERYQTPQLQSLDGASAFDVGGNDLFNNDFLTETHTIVADFSSQLNQVHLAKVGILARLHRLDNFSFGIEKSARTGNQPQPSPDRFADNLLQVNPIEFAAYVQDKMEFEGLIVNAGLRFDYFDPDYQIPNDWRQAEQDRVLNPDNPADSLSNRTAADRALQLSPRLGIAFPISAEGVMRFSAGLFFQTPQLSLLYTNPEYEVNPAANTVQFGNAGLEPERTLAFEVGLQQGLTEDIGLELTLFSKDVRNLTGQEVLRAPDGSFVVRWINRDYGTIRGGTLSLFRQSTAPISWTLDYTLQFAEGTSSDPGEAFGRQQSGLEPILSLVRLNWDRRHVLNNTLTIAPGEGNFTLTMVNRLRSGEPYTSLRNNARSTIPNNAERPFQFWSDLRLFYKPAFIKQDIQLLVQVINLFDNEIINAVYASSGRPDESLTLEQFRNSGTQVGGLNTLDEYFFRQEWYGPPRQISLGLTYRF